MRFLHLSNFPIPMLKEGIKGYASSSAMMNGKPQLGIWFAPGLLWVERMNRDNQWDISISSGMDGGFPYTLEIFQKIFSNSVTVPDSFPPAKDLGSKSVIYVYDLPVERHFEDDITKPDTTKILVLTRETIGQFEAGFNAYLRPILTDPEQFASQFQIYLSNGYYQIKRDISPSKYLIDEAARQGITLTGLKVRSGREQTVFSDLMIKAAFLTKARELGGDIDTLYDYIPKPRPPKDAILPFEDNLDKILSSLYGQYLKDVIQPAWGGIYYDQSLFPTSKPWFSTDRNNFARLYAENPELKRYPFLMWVEVASGTVWNPVSMFGTETLTPLCLVGVTNAPPTEDSDGNLVIAGRNLLTRASVGQTNTPIPKDANIFLAGVSTADNSVFFYRTGRIESTGGRRRHRKTRRRHRMSRKKTRVF